MHLFIAVSECLSYPDFSVVALYKKLVIGCGFLVPDVGFNEAYISFMAVRPGWQRSGVATFMLYHLIQVCSLFLYRFGQQSTFLSYLFRLV